MPTYSIEGPDGKTYSIDGPAGATRDQVITQIKKKQTEAAAPSALGDVASSFGRGVVKGAIGMAGLPGDLGNLANRGLDYAERKMGLEPPPLGPPVGSSAQIQSGVEAATGRLGEPQTTAGKYAQSVGEFVPSAALGPAGRVAKAATTVAGGLGAEAGGEMFGEPGRFIGGLVGGAAAGVAGAEAQSRKISAMLPGSAEHETAAKAAYKLIENNRIQTNNASITALTTGLKADLENRLIDQADAPAVFRAVDNLTKSNGELAATMALFENMGKVPPSAGEKYAAAQIVREGVLDWLEKLQPQDVISGDPQFVAAVWPEARGNWLAKKKLEMIEEQTDKAERQAAKTGAGANTENALRQRMDQILNSDKMSRGLSPEVKEKIQDVVRGNWLSNTARQIGKYAPSGPVSATTSILTGMEAGVPAGAAVAIGATLARELGTYLTKRQIREVEDMIKASSPIGRNAAQNLPARPDYQAIMPTAALRAGAASGLAEPPQ